MWEINFRSRIQGPISSGRMTRDAANYSHDVAEELAEESKDVWLDNLHGSLRHQTPFYTTRIAVRQLGANRYEVHDHDVVYGHWLEGTGSRNSPNSVFPGYWSLRRAKGRMKGRRSTIARKILRRYRASGRLI